MEVLLHHIKLVALCGPIPSGRGKFADKQSGKEEVMKYGELNLGQIEAIVNKLGGMDGVHRFLSGEMMVKARECDFPVWKTIKLGTGLKTADDFRNALKAGSYIIGDLANDILGKPSFKAATKETEVDLVKVIVAELGFEQGARRDQIYERAKDLGLELCPPEVGPQLRLQYRDQPNNEWILVGMESILDSGGDLRVFDVGRDGSGLWLSGDWGSSDGFWGAGCQWVFVRPRK